MNRLQIARQVQTLLRAVAWSDAEVAFASGSVLITLGITEDVAPELRLPLALIRPGKKDPDPGQDEEPGSVGIEFEPVTAGVLALTLNVAAYLSESLRGAIAGVDKGQWDAAQSLGLSWWQSMRHIIAPQGVRLAVPSLANSLISLIKDTSLVSVITVSELMMATKDMIAQTFQPLPLYLMAAAIYWVLSAVFERVQKRVEQHFAKAYQR